MPLAEVGLAPSVPRKPWYTNVYILLTILISVLATGFVAILLLLLFVLPWSDEILRYMQGKMLSLQSAHVEVDARWSGTNDGKPENVEWHSTGSFQRTVGTSVGKQSHEFALGVETDERRDFNGRYVGEGDLALLRFSSIPDRLDAVPLAQFRDRWLRLRLQDVRPLLSLPLFGADHYPLNDTDRATLEEVVRKTSFFEVDERLPDELRDGKRLLHYRVITDANNVLLRDLYERVEAGRLGRNLTDKERDAARTFFASLHFSNIEFWIGSTDHYLYRASLAATYDNPPRKGDLTLELRFADFDGGVDIDLIQQDAAGAEDLTSFVRSLLIGLQGRLPLAKEGSANVVAGGSGALPVDSAFQEQDTDADGIPDHLETFYQTNPRNADSDGDGRSDGDEVDKGCNPNGDGWLFDFGITGEECT